MEAQIQASVADKTGFALSLTSQSRAMVVPQKGTAARISSSPQLRVVEAKFQERVWQRGWGTPVLAQPHQQGGDSSPVADQEYRGHYLTVPVPQKFHARRGMLKTSRATQPTSILLMKQDVTLRETTVLISSPEQQLRDVVQQERKVIRNKALKLFSNKLTLFAMKWESSNLRLLLKVMEISMISNYEKAGSSPRAKS